MEFYNADVADIATIIKSPIDIIYMFNAFYAFSDQCKALSELNKIAGNNTQLVIFDYIALSEQPIQVGRSGSAIDLTVVADKFMRAEWEIQKITELNSEYRRWYENFVQKIVSKKTKILASDGEEFYQFVHKTYSDILSDIDNNLLGGAMICARKVI